MLLWAISALLHEAVYKRVAAILTSTLPPQSDAHLSGHALKMAELSHLTAWLNVPHSGSSSFRVP